MFTKLWRCTFYRNFSYSVVRRNLEEKTTKTSASSDSSDQGYTLGRMPTNIEKKILIYSGRYKTMEEIPKLVMPETLENSRTKLRIKIANIMILVTIIACGIVIYNGKNARKEKIKKWKEKEILAQSEKEPDIPVQQH